MAQIKAADVAKLRKMTGAGMMDCKKALEETNCDFDEAVDLLRKKGQKIASKRADRDASEGAVIAKVSENGKLGAMIVLNCETDFVAKNADFVAFATDIADIAISNNSANLDKLKQLSYKSGTVNEEVINQTGVIGEKIDLSFFEKIEAEYVIAYIHPGNKVASMVGFSKPNVDLQVAKDVAMQVAAMSPVSVDKDSVPQEVIDKEIEIGKEQALNEGKPAELAEKIAVGRLNKFFKESTLLSQQFIKDNKKSVADYIKESDKDLKVTEIKRFSLMV